MRISSRSARTLWAKASQESISIHNAFISCPFHHATICSRRIVIRLDYHPGCRAFLDRLRWTLQQRGGRAGMRLPRQTRGYRASSVINVDAAVVLVDGSCHRCHSVDAPDKWRTTQHPGTVGKTANYSIEKETQ